MTLPLTTMPTSFLLLLHLFTLTASVVQQQTCNSLSGICLAINAPNNTQDLNFQITAPKDAGWAAVGIGKDMEGALMFILYKNNANLTVSLRIGKMHAEPPQYNKTNFTLQQGTGIVDGKMVANIHCSDCISWDDGSIDLTSTSQPFIWAMGVRSPNHPESPSANIAKHIIRGDFVLDMTKAIGDPGMPLVSSPSGPLNKWMKVVVAHAVFMLIAWVLIFPSGAVIIRFLANKIPIPVQAHRVTQVTGIFVAILGLFLGLGASQGHVHYFHQTFGILLVSLLLPQLVLGWWHHHTYDPKFTRRRLVTHAHLWLGRGTIFLALINGGLGLNLFGISGGFQALYYILILGLTAMYIFAYLRQRKRNFKREMDSFLPPFEPTDDDDTNTMEFEAEPRVVPLYTPSSSVWPAIPDKTQLDDPPKVRIGPRDLR